MSIHATFRRLMRRTESSSTADNFDVFHKKTMASVLDSRGKSLGEWSFADADSEERCPRFILGLLRDRPDLRRRYPAATSTAGGYSEWLRTLGAREIGLSQRAISNIAAVFVREFGKPVREFYQHHPKLYLRYPLALLPVGQKKFVRWLFGKGRQQHSLTDEQILWFLHETAENLAMGIVETYLLNADWQQQFPFALVDEGQREFLQWLRRTFPKFAAFRYLKSLPEVFSREEVGALQRLVSTESNTSSSVARGVNLIGHFCYPSGLQQAALSNKRSLECAGVATSCRDLPTGVDTPLEPRASWLGLEFYPVTLITVAPVPLFEILYPRAGLAKRRGVYRIANWYWELENVSADWARFASLINEIWAPTGFVAEAFRSVMPLPVIEMLPTVSIDNIEKVSRAEFSIPENHFVFLFAFDFCSQMERKNPLALIRAFRAAFARTEPVTLLIKTVRGAVDSVNFARLKDSADENGVLVVDEFASRGRALGYIDMSDCFVSLHRSEGFGLGLAEAMLLGKPVIATNYSGNLAFMNQDNSLLVDCEVIEISESGPIYEQGGRWAAPSEAHAAELMRSIYENQEEARARATRSRPELVKKLAPETVGQRMKERLDEISRLTGDAPDRATHSDGVAQMYDQQNFS